MVNAAGSTPSTANRSSSAANVAGSGSSNKMNKGTSPKRPGKGLNWQMVAGVVVLFLVVAGAAAGFFLTQQSQDVRQQASVIDPGGDGGVECSPPTSYGDCVERSPGIWNQCGTDSCDITSCRSCNAPSPTADACDAKCQEEVRCMQNLGSLSKITSCDNPIRGVVSEAYAQGVTCWFCREKQNIQTGETCTAQQGCICQNGPDVGQSKNNGETCAATSVSCYVLNANGNDCEPKNFSGVTRCSDVTSSNAYETYNDCTNLEFTSVFCWDFNPNINRCERVERFETCPDDMYDSEVSCEVAYSGTGGTPTCYSLADNCQVASIQNCYEAQSYPNEDDCKDKLGSGTPYTCYDSTNNCQEQSSALACDNSTLFSWLADCQSASFGCASYSQTDCAASASCFFQDDRCVNKLVSGSACTENRECITGWCDLDTNSCQNFQKEYDYASLNQTCPSGTWNIYGCEGAAGAGKGCPNPNLIATYTELNRPAGKTLDSGTLGERVQFCGVVQVDCVGTSGSDLVFNSTIFDEACGPRKYLCIEGENRCTLAHHDPDNNFESYGTYDTLAECDTDCSPATTPPPGETPPPPVGPQCLNIEMIDAGSGQAVSSPAAGQTVRFLCGPEDGAITDYDFRVIEPDGNIVNIEPTSSGARQSQNYTIRNAAGQYHAQCRICTSGGCQPFEPVPGN